MANPSTEEVLNQVCNAIQVGAGPTPIDAVALTNWKNKYRLAFTTQLNLAVNLPDGWNRDKKNVLNAATQHGIIAAAVASIKHVNKIDWATLLTAGDMVQQQCHLTHGQGAWCA